MLTQFAIGGAMLLATMLVHGVLTSYGIEFAMAYLRKHKAPRSMFGAAFLVALFVLWLAVATSVGIWSWVLLYKCLGVFPTVEDAFYFSTVTMTTVGYGDLVVDRSWRVLAACQAANGTFLFGWSTALVFAIVQWTYTTYRQPDHKP